jgi:hypothetical protein
MVNTAGMGNLFRQKCTKVNLKETSMLAGFPVVVRGPALPSPDSAPRLSMLSRLTSGVAAGPGILGSAGWMQRAGIEGILGLRIRGTSLHLDPCIPKAWPGFGVVFRYRSARYEIQVENPQALVAVSSLPPSTARRYLETKRVSPPRSTRLAAGVASRSPIRVVLPLKTPREIRRDRQVTGSTTSKIH